MQQGGQGQGLEGRHPSSPQGGSSGNHVNMSKFSLLGQQLTNYGSAQQQQYHQQNLQAHQNPSNSSIPGNMNFSLGVQQQPHQQQQQAFSQNHSQQQQQQSQPNGGGIDGGGGGFASNIQTLNSLVAAAAAGQGGFNQSHQFLNQQVLQNTSVTTEFLKVGQQQASQAAVLGMSSAGGVSSESIMSALGAIQQKIGQLQAIVPLLAQNQQLTNPLVQQHAADAITQLAQVAANMFPPSQQPQQNPTATQQQQQSPTPDPHQLGQLFRSPSFNLFQQQQQQVVGGPGNPMLPNNFPPIDAAVPGSVGMAGMGSNQLAGVGGLQGSSQSLAGGPNKGSPADGQSFVGQDGSAVTTNSGLAVRSKQQQQLGSPRSSGAGGVVAGGGSGEMAQHMSPANNNNNNNRSSMGSGAGAMAVASPMEDHDVVGGMGSRGAGDDDDDGDGENLPPGSYELVEMEAIEILAEHTHFCEICGKGFKRDANLRMHMRGHGDEYKTPAALARPDKAAHDVAVVRPRRFSCPYVGCKRNKKHRKFQPLKTMLCVKNHYRRSHCPKVLTCNKCKTKKFSVVADLKTHEKHCGCDKWQCSCGTTFSRKDKLFGHIGLFAGHTPALAFNEVDSSGGLDGVPDLGSPNKGSGAGGAGGGYVLSSGGSLNSTSVSSMGLSGGSGMGLGGAGLQGLSSRVGGGSAGGLSGMCKDGSVVGPENSGSSDSFPSSGNLLPSSSMLQGLFANNYLQSTSGGNSSSDGLQ